MKVAVVGHDAGKLGGVGNFLRLMSERADNRVSIESIAVGPRISESGKAARVKRLLGDFFRFARRISKPDIDLVHLNPSLDQRSFVREAFLMTICIVMRRNFIVFFRGWDWLAFDRYFRTNDMVAKIVRSMLSKSSCFIVLAPSFAQALQPLFPCHEVHILTTMFDGNLMPSDNEKTFEAPRLLFMSRFIEGKGGRQTIAAFAEIARAYPKAELYMAGDGPARESWEAQAKALGEIGTRVRFLGYVREVAKLMVLNRANIFVMPTDHPEGMPNALMEAMGAGLVPVVTLAGGTFDAINHGEYGYMLQDSSAPGVVDAVTRIVDDPRAATAMSKNIRAHAWANFEANIVTEKLIGIYDSFDPHVRVSK